MDLDIVVGQQAIWLPAVAGLGVAIGLIAGMFGVGGGFLLVPMMHVVLRIPLPLAVGAALCQTIATGLSAFLRYRNLGLAEARFDWLLIGGSLLGVDAGTRILTALQGVGTVEIAGRSMPLVGPVVTAIYALVFVVMAYFMWARPSPSGDAELTPGPLARIQLPPMVDLPSVGLRVSGLLVSYIGFVNGALAGLLGIGGGILLVPIMLYGFGFNIRKAAGTGIAVVIVVAVLGTFQHARLGNVNLVLATTLMIGAALAAQVGASLTRALPAQLLRRGLAIVMIATIVALVVKLFR
jgi:uncharacterized protein